MPEERGREQRVRLTEPAESPRAGRRGALEQHRPEPAPNLAGVRPLAKDAGKLVGVSAKIGSVLGGMYMTARTIGGVWTVVLVLGILAAAVIAWIVVLRHLRDNTWTENVALLLAAPGGRIAAKLLALRAARLEVAHRVPVLPRADLLIPGQRPARKSADRRPIAARSGAADKTPPKGCQVSKDGSP